MVIWVKKNSAGPLFSHFDKWKHQPYPVINTHTTFAYQVVGKNWAGPFFPHPDKIKHQPFAGGYLGGEKLGCSIFTHPINHMHNSFSPSDNLVHKVDV